MPKKRRFKLTWQKGSRNRKAALKKLESAAFLLVASDEKHQVANSGISTAAPESQHFTVIDLNKTNESEEQSSSEKISSCDMQIVQRVITPNPTIGVTVMDNFNSASLSNEGGGKTEGHTQSERKEKGDVQMVQMAHSPSTPMGALVMSDFFPANLNQSSKESSNSDDDNLKLSSLAKKTELASREKGMVFADETNQDDANISEESNTVKTTSSREINFFTKVVRRLEAFTSEIN